MQYGSDTRKRAIARAAWPWMLAWGVGLAAWMVLSDGGYAWRRFSTLGVWGTEVPSVGSRLARQAVFASSYALAFAALLALPFMRRRWAVPVLGVLAACTVVDLSYLHVTGKSAGLADVAILNASVGSLGDAVSEFGLPIAQAAAVTSLAFVPAIALALLMPRHARRNAPAAFAALTLLGAAYVTTAFAKGDQGLLAFPRGFSYAYGSVVLAADGLQQRWAGKAPEAVERLASPPPLRKIVLVIDESVRWREFSRLWTKQESAVDFGAAMSSANCSAPSNFMLRKAALRTDGPVEVPSLFALARQAGFTTTYIDNQAVLRDPTVRNYFDHAELATVDVVVSRGERPRHEIDLASLDALQAILRRDGADFVIVNKWGAHFPYETALPPDQRTASRQQNYERAIAYQSVAYLRRLARQVGPDTIVFYTSDHGQGLEGGASHCNSGNVARPEEWSVPIVVLTGDRALRQRLRAAAEGNAAPATHFELTEAVRNALGFEAAGDPASLLEPASMKSRVARVCGYWGPPKPLFGRAPACVPLVEPANPQD